VLDDVIFPLNLIPSGAEITLKCAFSSYQFSVLLKECRIVKRLIRPGVAWNLHFEFPLGIALETSQMFSLQRVEIAFDPFEREHSISAYAPVAGYGWGVVAQQPTRTSTALAAKNYHLRRLLIAYGLILLLFVSAMYLATRIVIQRRQAEEDRRVKAELERRVAERTAQLEAAYKELESFSYSVSHDLRAPLRAIDGFSRILEGDFSERLDNEGRRLLKVIRDSSRSMGQLIDDLLAFSRLGRKAVASAEIDMRKLAEETLEEVEASAERRVKVVIGPLPPGYADAGLIRQVWHNLLSNAVKFSSKREQPVVEVSGYEDERYHVYCVKDNGAGFDMQYYDKLFGVFQRLHDGGEFPGTGVGLAIVQRVITKHGGRVWAEGKVDGGAAFYFALPKREAA
jgi:signal transduction histidine kinase